MSGYLKENFDKNGKTISFRIGASRGKDNSGKYPYEFKTVKTDSKRVAQKALRELQTQIDKATYIKPGKQTVKEYFESWLKDIAGSNRTYQGYEYNVNKYIIPSLGQLALTGLKAEHIKRLCAEQKEKGHYRTAQYIFSTFSKSLNVAVKAGIIVRNPVDGVEKPKVERHEFKTLSEDDLNKFLEGIITSEYYPLFFTDLFCGMRRSELLAIRWKDTDLLGMTISVNRTLQQLRGGELVYLPPKTAKSRRLIALSPANCIVLRDHKAKQEQRRQSLKLKPLGEDDLVFSHYDGSPYLPETISHVWLDLMRDNDFSGIRLHDARHTMASIMLKQGVHPKIVQERLGHATISTTLDIYSQVVPGLQAAAAANFDNIIKHKESKLDKELKEIIPI